MSGARPFALVLYNDPLIAKSTDTSTFHLDDLQYGPQPVALYGRPASARSSGCTSTGWCWTSP